ncbi:biotin/lipoyl-containing protein [Streptomyces sp. NPDC004539]|uniref:acetyl-CoA carboxylase biotin carboxyl carrier protein n=1 Tax=Streptomyces sp. NPDC004539 TaxID=3154280 RepID=UPI0033AB229F
MSALRPGAEDEAVVGGVDTGLLERVRDAVVVLLAGLPGTPARLRVRVWDVEMELDWAVPVPGGPSGAGAGPAAAPEAVRPPAGAGVTSSSVGTFYRRPEPGAEPFVRVGDRVRAGQQLAIVEVMKLMIPVEADRDGVVTEVLAEDGQSVEYGQLLFALGPVG